MASQTELALDAVPAYVQYAKEVLRLVNEEHMNSTEAARSLGIDPQTARQAYKFSKHGLKSDDVDPNHGKQETSFKRTQGAEVAHRRDELDQPFHVIAEAMGVTRETARKSYNLHHQQIAEKTGDTERLKDLGRNSRMSLTKRQRIREMLKAGHSVNEVVAEVGCSKTVVYREKRKL
tara:strand:+ start:41 stop:571 length:531 start_codon:yes stop_codon:yes gene_type:complete